MRVLYLSFDGLTDPLGGSQIVPYLEKLARRLPVRITVVSLEKAHRARREGAALRARLAAAGVGWIALPYLRLPRGLGSLLNLASLTVTAWCWALLQRPRLVHCRSYVAGLVGLLIKRTLGSAFLFDIRGFWVDERVDGGLWPAGGWKFRLFKGWERALYRGADQVVVLSQRAVPIVRAWALPSAPPITAVPCCADFTLFAPQAEAARRAVRDELKFGPHQLVVGYLGSLGTWYLLPDMLDFFVRLRRTHPDSCLLMITADWDAQAQAAWDARGLPAHALRVVSLPRSRVPAHLSACDLSLSFIRACFSKQASSPTKLAEVVGVGVPVLISPGIGDSDEQVNRWQAGLVLAELSVEAYDQAIAGLPQLLKCGGERARELALAEVSLPVGVERYAAIYAACGAGSG